MPLAQFLIPIFQLVAKGKLADSFSGQKTVLQKLRQLKISSPCLWVHVSSAGEFLQARPVLDEIKNNHPEVFIVLSFVSPSGMRWAKDYKNADVVSYLPLDTKENMREMLAILRPKVLLLVKFDLWPNLVTCAHQAGVKSFLISATLTASSGRYRNPWAKKFFSQIYANIDHIFCVGPDDRQRFLETNPSHPDLRVVGDTRVDSVLSRQQAAAGKDLPANLQQIRKNFNFVIVAGSVWPADQEILLPAWQNLLKDDPSALLILVPHEPNEFHLVESEALCLKHGLKSVRYSQYPEGNLGHVLLMDKVGMLAELYRIGNGAFVGAGAGGVHNTMEPAAWRLPVQFRPNYQNAPEAIALVAQEVFKVVATPAESAKELQKWLKNPQNATELGSKGRDFLEKSKGATYTCYQSILQEL